MIKLEFTEQEIQWLANLMNAGVRAIGLDSVIEAAALKTKIQAAITAAAAPVPKEAPAEVPAT